MVVYFSAIYLENGGVTVLKKTHIVLDFGFYSFNFVTSFNHKRDGFPSESIHKICLLAFSSIFD